LDARGRLAGTFIGAIDDDATCLSAFGRYRASQRIWEMLSMPKITRRFGRIARAVEHRLKYPAASISRHSRVERSVRLQMIEGGRIVVEPDSIVNHDCVLATASGTIRIGKRAYVGHRVVLYGHGGLTIGEDVLIGPNACVIAMNHRFDRVDTPINSQGETREGIVIENGVWICADAVITDGVRIGSGAVVGAGAVVTHDVPSGAVVAGVPARVIALRGERAREVIPLLNGSGLR
jgi:acetyltransferase-like isoleucine patch superfamily enzyme